jgi:hypothetical protein
VSSLDANNLTISWKDWCGIASIGVQKNDGDSTRYKA